jgi:putative transposase
MSLARAIVPGRVYMVTRRTNQRQFLLRPSREVNGAVRYCLALAAERTGIDLHLVVFLSNHYHLVLSDPEGRLPKFTELFNGFLARCLNCHWSRWEAFWAAGKQTSYVALEDEQAVLAKSVYALLNPVDAGLVKDFRHWPGELLVQPGAYKARKPAFFFRTEEDGGTLPDRLTLSLTAPPVPGPPEKRMPLVYDMAKAFMAQTVADRKRKGLSFAGADAVRRQPWSNAPNTREPRRKRSPRIATRDKWRRIEAIRRDQQFAQLYRACRARWCAGDRDIEWPPGTYKMHRVHNARCAPCADV